MTPKIVEAAPVIAPHERFWWNAYCDLCHERNHLGLIPPSAMLQYADRWGVPYHHLRAVIDGVERARK